jgi:hypothetical protein
VKFVRYGVLQRGLLSVVFITVVIVVLASLIPTSACIDPRSLYAVEVVLNKPGVKYNLTMLEQVAGDSIVKVDNSTYVFKYTIYHYSLPRWELTSKIDFLVELYEAKFCNNAPFVPGVNDQGEVEYYLGVRVELIAPPNTTVLSPLNPATTQTIVTTIEVHPPLTTTMTVYSPPSTIVRTNETTTEIGGASIVTVSVIRTPPPTLAVTTSSLSNTFVTTTPYNTQTTDSIKVSPWDYKMALRGVLSFLTSETGVVVGLSLEDIDRIVQAAEPGKAGWNSRLIYSSLLGYWAPYDELINSGVVKGALLRGNTCGFSISFNIVNTIDYMKPLLNTTISVYTPHTPSPQSTVIYPTVHSTPLTMTTTPSIPVEYPTLTPYRSDYILVTVSIIAGVLASLIIYIVISKRY